MEKARRSIKTSTSASLTIRKSLTLWITTKCIKFLKLWEYQTPPYLSPEKTVSQKATIRTGHGTTDWLKIRKGVCQGCLLSLCLLTYIKSYYCCSVTQLSDSLWPHRLQHNRYDCPSPSPGVGSNSCPLSQWCYPTISSSVVPFFSYLQSFPASGSFLMNQCCVSGDQSIRASASASVLPMNISGWFSLGWTGWISLQSKGLSRVFFNTTF